MASYTCKNCGSRSHYDDPGTNWNVLGRRNGKLLLGCDCGHGLHPGMFSSKHVGPEVVAHQRRMMEQAGIVTTKRRSIGDVEQAFRAMPPSPSDLDVGDVVEDHNGDRGTIVDVTTDRDGRWLHVDFETGGYVEPMQVHAVKGKLRRVDPGAGR